MNAEASRLPNVLGELPVPAHAAPDVVRYYAETTEDYRAWSRNLNMHFGYFRWGMNPLRLERMLEEMSLQVLARLERGGHKPVRLLDMGCGAGAPTVFLARRRPELNLHGITLLEHQVELGSEAAARHGVAERVRFSKMDYTATSFGAASFDSVMAIESACHAAGTDKATFVREAARLVAPGGRLVVADGFLKRPIRSAWLRWPIDFVSRNWAVSTFAELAAFCAALTAHGFVDLEVEETSWNVAPSLLHIPIVTARFVWQELRRNGLHLSRVRWGHVLASLVAPLVGAARPYFGYYLISARRR